MIYSRPATPGDSDPWLTLITLAEGRPEMFKHIPAGDPFLCLEIIWDETDVNLNLCISVLWEDKTCLMFCNSLELQAVSL